MKGFILIVILVVIINTVFGVTPIDDSDKCISCQQTIQSWQDTWTNETSIDNVITSLKNNCKEKYSIKDILKRELCDKVVDVLVQIPPGIFEGLNTLAWPIPSALCATVRQCDLYCCDDSNSPEQIHLSADTDTSIMTVSWTTLNSQQSFVQYGISIDTLDKQEQGDVNTYTPSGWRGSLHSATMTGLISNQVYFYRVGDGADKWSEIFSFKTFDTSKPIVYGVIGDMAYDEYSDYTVKRMIELVDQQKLDAVIHVGDISYADGYDPHFDDFFRKIQPIAARVPYMVSPGNHEFWYDFVAYKNRFNMPGSKLTKSMYYQWSNGPVKFISLNSETAIDTADFHELEIQFLKKTLENTNRLETPFVVVHFHRPLYCSNDDECYTKALRLRKKAEDILYSNHIDLVLNGHIHSYERTLNIYNNTVDPLGPVYIIQGASGNREGNKGPFPADLPAWSAHNEISVGYGLLTVSNSQMEFSFYDSATNAELDHVVIEKR